MNKKLSPTQQELLDAMRRGVVVHYMGGIDAYYFRSDTMKRCTSTALALHVKGMAVHVGSLFRRKLVAKDST